jgi:hypothetical protein
LNFSNNYFSKAIFDSFSKSVSEAWWRLQLITDILNFVDYEKKYKNFIPQPQRGYLSSASSSNSDSEQQEKQRPRKTSKILSRADNTDKSSGSGSNTTGNIFTCGIFSG